METKKCNKCNNLRSIDEFFLKEKGRYQWCCKFCLYDYQKERWKQRKYEAVKLMGGKCIDCGYCKNYCALEFHHVDPNKKDFQWDQMRQLKWSSIIVELKKCVLLCSNCHRERHHPEFSIDHVEIRPVNVHLQAKEIEPTGKCLVCENFVYGTKFCCVECASKSRRKVSRPSRLELEKLLENHSFVAVGKMFGVSDNAIRKWLKFYKISPS